MKVILTLKFYILIILLLGSNFAYSQLIQTQENSSTTLNQLSENIGISLQVSNPSTDDIRLDWLNVDKESTDNYNLKNESYSVGFLINYNLENESIIRFRFGVTNNSIEKTYGDTRPGYAHSGKGKQIKLHFAPGIVWKMNDKKFTIYGGFEIPVNLHGEFKMTMNSPVDKITTTLPNGYSFGMGALMGFNYFPASWISFGAEFSPSLLNANLSGKTKSVETLWGTQITTETQDADKGFMYYEQRFSINVAIWI